MKVYRPGWLEMRVCVKRNGWNKQRTESDLQSFLKSEWRLLPLKFIRSPDTFGIFGILWIRKDSFEKLLTFPCVFVHSCLTYCNFWISAFSNFQCLPLQSMCRVEIERSIHSLILIHQTDFYRLSVTTWCWVKMKVTQSCQTLCLCDPMDYVVRGILQARILEWIAYPFSSGSSQPRNWSRVSCIAGGLFTNWTMLGMQ